MKRINLSRLLSDHGMLGVLLLLCAFFSWATFEAQHPTGEAGARQLARQISRQFPAGARLLIAARESQEDVVFARSLERQLRARGFQVVATVTGPPAEARQMLANLDRSPERLDVIAGNQVTAAWSVFENLGRNFPHLASTQIVRPQSYRWPNFLKTDNLLNVANQIAVIAMIAIGMTLVIITGGIDLSVGSLIALSAVVAAWIIQEWAGAEQAAVSGMVLAGLAGILVCGLMGCFSGLMITQFGVPAFIVTLGMMLVGSGLAFMVARGESIYRLPDSFVWLGRQADLGVPNAVLLMLGLYTAAHLVMTRTVLGRYIYAIGGNVEAARLSGVPVKRVVVLVYAGSGLLAGLGGIVMASQLKSGAPTYGQMYELYVIAAAVVGGASLTGGEGRIFGTLIGAFIIAVIQNGMNLTGVESYTQKVVLGLVILGAVLLDQLKKREWRLFAFKE